MPSPKYFPLHYEFSHFVRRAGGLFIARLQVKIRSRTQAGLGLDGNHWHRTKPVHRGTRSKGISTNQPYGNLKLSTDHLPWPVDPNDTNLALVPLVEPIGRLAPAFPSSWPENITGETPHSAMANEISALVRADFRP